MTILSVIMPVYNGEAYLNEAIDSILNQTFSDFEFIIIDDGSQDNTWKIIQSYNDPRIHSFHQPNMGVANTLNKCLELCNKESRYIARMDADDIALPMRFARQIEFMEANTDVGLVATNVKFIDEWGNYQNKYYPDGISQNYLEWRFLFGNPIIHPTVVIRKSVLDQNCLLYNTEYETAEDYRLWMDFRNLNLSVDVLNEVLLNYRILPSSVSRKNQAKQIKYNAELVREEIHKRYLFGNSNSEVELFASLVEKNIETIPSNIVRLFLNTVIRYIKNSASVKEWKMIYHQSISYIDFVRDHSPSVFSLLYIYIFLFRMKFMFKFSNQSKSEV